MLYQQHYLASNSFLFSINTQTQNEYGFLETAQYLPVCTAQGGSGSFKDRKPIGGWLLWMMDRRANEPMGRQAVGGSAVEL